MKKNRRNFLFALIAIWVLGTLLHFVYDWSNQSPIAAIFAATNESVWEHGKLVFWPLALFFLIQDLRKKLSLRDAVAGAAAACWSSLAIMIMLFYTYTGATGMESLIFDIAIFFFATFIGLILGQKAAAALGKGKTTYIISAIAFLLLLIGFILFTFSPTALPVFTPLLES